MALIGLIFRQNLIHLNKSLQRVRLLDEVKQSSYRKWTQPTARPVSYVSNLMRLSAKKRPYLVVGLTFGSATVALLLLNDYFKQNKFKFNRNREMPSAAAQTLQAAEVPQTIASRIVWGPTNVDMKFTLYQYQTCPFCCKVRAFLDYYGIPYDVIEVNPVLRQQIKFSKYRKVPILLVQKNGEEEVLQINDSTTIVSALASYLISRKPESRHYKQTLKSIIPWYQNVEVVKEDGNKVNEIINRYFLMFGDISEQKYKKIESSVAEERNWRRWADDHLVHDLSPNIYRTMDESLRSFRYFSIVGEWDKHFSVWERYLVIYMGASAMYFIGKKLKKKHCLKDDVRLSLYDSCRHWLKAVGKDRKFMGGDKPNLADLSVYGVLNSIEGCDAFKDLLKETKIGLWYYSVQELVKTHSGAKQLTYLKP